MPPEVLPWPAPPDVSTSHPLRAGIPAHTRPVLLVSMPFMDIDRPSIQLGLLKAICTQHGFPARTLHANLDFAARIGAERYRLLSEHRGHMIGDWLFSPAAFGDSAPDMAGALPSDVAADLTDLGALPADVRAMLLQIRDADVPAYLDHLLDTVPWSDVGVVGFTSTFQQNAASFALARRLKDQNPGLVTVFGGANFDGEMGLELVRAIDCIDYAVIGEGDAAFPALLAALASGLDPGAVPGVARRTPDGTVAWTPPAGPLATLDTSPAPDYAEYFDHAEQLGLLPRTAQRQVWIPFESARGCWWGAKHHCTFCGLNGSTMQFRAKPAPRLLAELSDLAKRYRSFHFQAVDNILDMTYLTQLFPALVASGTEYEIFYEVKANLSRAQVRQLAQAGVTQIQPGIESLSTHVLQLLRKGVRAAQNVNLLRWARYYGVDVGWNVLCGHPGETDQDYTDQIGVLPHLRHLQPPATVTPIWMERFSPLYTERATLPIRDVGPERSYRYVYPDGVDLDRVAYFFEYELSEPAHETAAGELAAGVTQWQHAWHSGPPTLTYRYAPGFLQIAENRGTTPSGTYTFDGALAEIYVACAERPTTAAAVHDQTDGGVPVELVQEAFGEFARRGLMFLDGSLALALALPSVEGR
jgi:ribosomal peptide maturation radical SAM protein 1